MLMSKKTDWLKLLCDQNPGNVKLLFGNTKNCIKDICVKGYSHEK